MADERERRARRRLFAKWGRRVVLGLFVAGLAWLLALAMMPQPVPVDLAEVERGTLRVTVDEDGRTRVADRYAVSAPLTGTLGRVELQPGDPVEEGTVVARLVPLARPLMDAQGRAEAEARLAAAEAQLRQARASADRARAALAFQEREASRQEELHRSGTIPAASIEQARFALRSRRDEAASARFGTRVAAHQVQVARAALGRFDSRDPEQMEVTTPVSGVVLRVVQRDSGVVQAGQALMEIGDPANLEIAVDVLTSDAVRIEPGARVTIRRWGGEGELEGHVRLVEPSAFTRTSALGVEEQRVNAIIDLDSPREQWARLGDGYRVETQIRIWEADDVLRAPGSAVFRRGDGWAAYRVVGDQVEEVALTTGQRNGMFVQVEEGLSEGDRVVAHPSDRVVPGARIVER